MFLIDFILVLILLEEISKRTFT
jgi:hypothetical protein